jgi:iron complex outermembrane receptor protein
MKPNRKDIAALAFLAGALSLAAQTPAAAPATSAASDASKTKEEVVQLSPFMVSAGSENVGRYSSFESTSAGRVRLNVMDSSQSVSVITNELIQDVGAGRLLDATKYISGISESTLGSNANERTNVRGFQADGHTVDGFTYGGFMNLDPAIVDRIDVVKGPNSILAPQPTSPGGTVNNSTKKPGFSNFAAVNLQVGEFDANSAWIDVNRALNDKLAVRVIGSARDWDNWWEGSSIRSYTVMPGVTYKFSDRAQLTVQYIYTDWHSTLYLGLPIDPSSGTLTKARILDGVPRDLSVFNENDIYRTDRQHDFKALLTAELPFGIQMRLNALYHKSSQYAPQLNTGNSTGGTGGNRDPLTGNYIPGMQFLQVAPYTGTPITTQPTRVFARSGTDPRDDPRMTMLQNDYVYQFENDYVKSTTLLGFAYSQTINYNNRANNISAPNFNIDTYTDVPWTLGTLNFYNQNSSRFQQGYISENLSLFKDRVILSGAQSKQYYRQRTHNMINGVVRSSAPDTSLPSYGIVVKPYKDMFSLYYGYSEQSSANTPSTTGAFVPQLTSSKQKEFGARAKLWGDKLYVTVAHFDIVQDNFSVPNPGNLTTPPPSPLLPALFMDRTAKGWEYELRANPTKNISIIANYTSFENRDPNNVKFRGTAEKTGAALVSYKFDAETVPALDGFRVAVGVEYIGDRPGDAASGFTAASTPTNPIPNQPSFYLGARTLTTLILGYDSKKNWSVQLNVDNLLDEEYLMAAINRSLVYVGTPRNFRGSFTYKF